MAVEIIPIEKAGDDGAFYFTVALDGSTYELRFQFNSRDGFWYFAILDLEGNRIRSGVRVVINWPSIRLDKSLLRPPGELLFLDTRTDRDNPGLDDLGETAILTYTPEADLP